MALTMSLIERVRVQRRVAEARASEPPLTWEALASQEGVPERTLRHMHSQWVQVQELYDDPLGLIGETLDTLTALIDEASNDIANAPNANAKVGFTRVLLDLMVKRINLLIQVGRMPRNIGDYAEFPSVRQMILDMAEVVERHDLGPEVIDDLLAIVERADRQAKNR
jgi:chorismate mutase